MWVSSNAPPSLSPLRHVLVATFPLWGKCPFEGFLFGKDPGRAGSEGLAHLRSLQRSRQQMRIRHGIGSAHDRAQVLSKRN